MNFEDIPHISGWWIVGLIAVGVVVGGMVLAYTNPWEASIVGTVVFLSLWATIVFMSLVIAVTNHDRANEAFVEEVDQIYDVQISPEQASELRGTLWFMFGVTPGRLEDGLDEDSDRQRGYGQTEVTVDGETVTVALIWDGSAWVLGEDYEPGERGEEPTWSPLETSR